MFVEHYMLSTATHSCHKDNMLLPANDLVNIIQGLLKVFGIDVAH